MIVHYCGSILCYAHVHILEWEWESKWECEVRVRVKIVAAAADARGGGGGCCQNVTEERDTTRRHSGGQPRFAPPTTVAMSTVVRRRHFYRTCARHSSPTWPQSSSSSQSSAETAPSETTPTSLLFLASALSPSHSPQKLLIFRNIWEIRPTWSNTEGERGKMAAGRIQNLAWDTKSTKIDLFFFLAKRQTAANDVDDVRSCCCCSTEELTFPGIYLMCFFSTETKKKQVLRWVLIVSSGNSSFHCCLDIFMRWVWWSRKRDPRVVGEKSSNLAFFQKIMFLASHNHIPAVELIKLSARLKKTLSLIAWFNKSSVRWSRFLLKK